MSTKSHPLGFLRAQVAFAVATLAALDGIPGALSISTFRRINDGVEDMKIELAALEAQFEADAAVEADADTADNGTDAPVVPKKKRGSGNQVAEAEASEAGAPADNTKPLFDETAQA